MDHRTAFALAFPLLAPIMLGLLRLIARLVIVAGLLVLTILAGCSQTMYLYPRPQGAPIQGELSTTASTMTIALDGETYHGSFKRGRSFGFGAAQSGTRFGTAIGTSMSNQYAGLLTSEGGKALRCEFIGGLGETGNGICQHGDGRFFDLLLKP